MRRKRERRRCIIILISILLVIATAVGVVWYLKSDVPGKEILTTTEQKKVNNKDEAEPTYITETCFDGSTEMDPVLYSIPFKKSEYYIMNKDLVKTISEKRATAIMERAGEVIQCLFKIDGKDIAKNPDDYKEKMNGLFLKDSYFINEAELHQSSDEYIAKYLKTAADSKIQTEVTFETDKSLVYEDLEYFVRGLIKLKVYQLDQKEKDNLKKIFPFELKDNTTYTAVYEVGLGSGEKSRAPKDMKVYSLNVIKLIDKK